MKFIRSHRAFSLIEAIVGVTIIAIIAVASYLGVSTCFRADLSNSDQTLAVHFVQKIQEEIRQAAQTHFDQLTGCNFITGNPCGLPAEIPVEFNRFVRHVSIRNEGSSELKRIEINVTWQDPWGKNHALPSVMFLARPPDPLPGNIVGLVSDQGSGHLLGGVRIDISNGIVTYTISSGYALLARANDNKEINYDFSKSTGYTFTLRPGKWNLRANRSNYEPYVRNQIEVFANKEEQIDFAMTPKPPTPTPEPSTPTPSSPTSPRPSTPTPTPTPTPTLPEPEPEVEPEDQM